MTRLRLRTLGGLSVSREGTPLSGAATQPRRLAVLALVARAGDRGITREAVIARLWPDTPEESARRSLAQSLHALRRDLDEDGLFLGVQDLRLNRDACAADVLEFEAALAEGDYDRAVACYEGPFLHGFRLPGAEEFERWVEGERQHLAQRHLEALERLARNAAARGESLAAAQWWRKLAGHDPLNARIAVELMRALAAAGERHAALQHARIYEALVAEELGLEPDNQVAALAEELRRSPAEPPAPAAAPPSPLVAPAPEAMGPAVDAAPAVTGAPRRRRGHLVGLVAVLVLAGVALGLLWPGRGRHPAGHLLAVGAVLDYRVGQSTSGDPVGEMLATNLARVPGLQVLSSARLLELMEPPEPGADTRGAWARAARRAGATDLVEGGLHRLGADRILFELRRVDLGTGEVRTAHRLEGTDPFELVGRATGEIAVSLGLDAHALDPADVSTRSLVAFRFYEEGLRAFSRGDFRGAEQLLDAALREDSLFALAAYYRWQARTRRGQPPAPGEVERLRALSTRAPDRERLLIQGWLALRFDEGSLRASADTLAVRYPAELDGHFLLGLAHLADAAWGDALPHFRQVFALDSTMLGSSAPRCHACDALEQMIYAYHAMDSLERAEEVARDWGRRDPQSARPRISLAANLFAQGRLEEALAARRAATEGGPFDVYDAVWPAAVRLRAGDAEEAERATRGLLRNAPDTDVARQAHWLLVLTLRYQRRWDQALALIEGRAAATPATSPERHLLAINRAIVSFEAGRYRQAGTLWDSLARSPGPSGSEVNRRRRAALEHAMAAGAWAAAGDTARLRQSADSADALTARGGTRRPLFHAAHARGVLAAARGDTARAIAEFRRAIFSPTLGFTRTSRDLAELLIASGRPAEAVPLLQAALRGPLDGSNLYVTHTDLHELLAAAWTRLGRPDSAAPHAQWVATVVSGGSR